MIRVRTVLSSTGNGDTTVLIEQIKIKQGSPNDIGQITYIGTTSLDEWTALIALTTNDGDGYSAEAVELT